MTDGMGRMDYVYDTLSRLKTETRQFNGLGSFALNYDYNVAGELNSITDPFGHQVSYTFDKTGRVTGVTGSPFGNVTQYASNLQYRAWGALKSMSYGNGMIQNQAYTSRSQLQSLTVSGRNSQ